MKRYALLMIFICEISFAQGIDTTKIMKVFTLSDSLKSIQNEMKNISGDIAKLKKQITEGSDFDKLLAMLEEKEIADVPEEQRSKNKRLDALLKIFNQQPGKLIFNGTAIALLQNNFSNKSNAGMGVLDIYAHTTLGDGILFFSSFEVLGGNGLSAKANSFLPLFANEGSTQDEDGLDRVGLLESWLEFELLNSEVTITAGKIDLTNYFDNNSFANDETAQFISSNFVNNGTIPFFEITPGIRLRTSFLKFFHLQLALASRSNSGDNIFNDLIRTASIGIRTFGDSGWEGNLRLYGYNFSKFKKTFGFGLSLDQSIFHNYGIFLRFGKNNSYLSSYIPIETSYSGGLSGKIYSGVGKSIRMGLGYAHNDFYNSNIKEYIVELYMRYQFNKWIFISPHLQYFVKEESNVEHKNFIFGLRTQLNF